MPVEPEAEETRTAFCHACGGEVALTIDGWVHTGGYAGEPHPILLGLDAEPSEDELGAMNIYGRILGNEETEWEWHGLLSSASLARFLIDGLTKTVKNSEWKMEPV